MKIEITKRVGKQYLKLFEALLTESPEKFRLRRKTEIIYSELPPYLDSLEKAEYFVESMRQKSNKEIMEGKGVYKIPEDSEFGPNNYAVRIRVNTTYWWFIFKSFKDSRRINNVVPANRITFDTARLERVNL